MCHIAMEHGDDVNVVALSPDRRWVVSGSGNNQERTLIGHADGVRAVAVTPDGRHAISASDDGALKVWEPANRSGIGNSGPAGDVILCRTRADWHHHPHRGLAWQRLLPSLRGR